MKTVKLATPDTQQSLSAYFHFRWQLLREPWQQPPGSEQDEHDAHAYHVMALFEKKIVGVGRLHQLNHSTAQIRYMAVAPEHRQQGIGAAILQRLEQESVNWHRYTIKLNARQSALGFYLKHGYEIKEDGPVLFGEIQHKLMQKTLLSQ